MFRVPACSTGCPTVSPILHALPLNPEPEQGGIQRTVAAYAHIRREEWDKAQAQAKAAAPVRKALGGGFGERH